LEELAVAGEVLPEGDKVRGGRKRESACACALKDVEDIFRGFSPAHSIESGPGRMVSVYFRFFRAHSFLLDFLLSKNKNKKQRIF
jgi:hypothetical protein